MTVILVFHHKMNSNIYINMSGKILNIYLTSDMCSDINSIYLTCKSNKMQPFDISSKDISRSSYKNLYWNKLPVPLLDDSKIKISVENGHFWPKQSIWTEFLCLSIFYFAQKWLIFSQIWLFEPWLDKQVRLPSRALFDVKFDPNKKLDDWLPKH